MSVLSLLLDASEVDHFDHNYQTKNNQGANGRIKLAFYQLSLYFSDDYYYACIGQWS
jgi:hypothetical protein